MKQIIIGTVTILDQFFWTASYSDASNTHIIGSSVPEAVGSLLIQDLEIIYTESAKAELEEIQRVAAQLGSTEELVEAQFRSL